MPTSHQTVIYPSLYLYETSPRLPADSLVRRLNTHTLVFNMATSADVEIRTGNMLDWEKINVARLVREMALRSVEDSLEALSMLQVPYVML